MVQLYLVILRELTQYRHGWRDCLSAVYVLSILGQEGEQLDPFLPPPPPADSVAGGGARSRRGARRHVQADGAGAGEALPPSLHRTSLPPPKPRLPTAVSPVIRVYGPWLVQMLLSFSLVVSSYAVRMFSKDRVMYCKREEPSGMMILPYFLGKVHTTDTGQRRFGWSDAPHT